MREEYVLDFALRMKNEYEKFLFEHEEVHQNSIKDPSLLKTVTTLYPAYGDILQVIKDCEYEIAYKTQKQNGRRNEKTRTAAAKRLLKNMSHFGCAKQENSILINEYIGYMGSPIIGIEEYEKLEKYEFYKNTFDKFVHMYNTDKNAFQLNLDDMKSRYKIAKTEYKNSKSFSISRVSHVRDVPSGYGYVKITNNDGQDVYFDSSLLIDLCILMDGNNYTIQVGSPVEPAIVRCDNDNIGVIMPFRKSN